jgi:hypothetical protein
MLLRRDWSWLSKGYRKSLALPVLRGAKRISREKIHTSSMSYNRLNLNKKQEINWITVYSFNLKYKICKNKLMKSKGSFRNSMSGLSIYRHTIKGYLKNWSKRKEWSSSCNSNWSQSKQIIIKNRWYKKFTNRKYKF